MKVNSKIIVIIFNNKQSQFKYKKIPIMKIKNWWDKKQEKFINMSNKVSKV